MPVTTSEILTPCRIKVLTCSGGLGVDEILEAAVESLEKDPTPLVLWDALDADLSEISLGKLSRLFVAVKPLAEVRRNGRTALLATPGVAYGVGRWASAMGENAGLLHPIRPFLDRQSALDWLSAAPACSSSPHENTGAA